MLASVGDLALITAAQSGDAEAFAALVRHHVPRLHRYLVATGVSHHDADDLVQDAFLRVHRHLDRYDPRYAFTTWLFTIAHRLRLSFVHRRHTHADLASVSEPVAVEVETNDDDGPGSTWTIARRVLSERHFQLLWLRYGEDLEMDDIARICGCSVINVRVSLHRARAKLETYLRAEGLAPVAVGGTSP